MKLSRRQLLKMLATALGSIGLGRSIRFPFSSGDELQPRSYLPFIGKPTAPTETPTSTTTPTDTHGTTPDPTTPTVTETTSPGSTPSPSTTVSPDPNVTETPTSTSTSTPTATETPTNTPTATETSSPPPPPDDNRVVHVHDPTATYWNGETDFWAYVDQVAVTNMIEQGLQALTSTTSVVAAWQALLPDYQVGQGIAIKINLNNSSGCGDADGQIDALIEPVNALVQGLLARGVAAADIWIYDAVRPIPDRLVANCPYSGVQFFDSGACRDPAGFSSNDPHAYVAFSPPPGVPQPGAERISDILIHATYLINLAIMKKHFLTGTSLTFKNHFGTINNPGGMHDYVGLDKPYYRTDYSAFIDIYQNPHVGAKTILNVGDGLFSARGFNQAPRTWVTFGNEVPNSIFLARDAVAMDCVMCDFLNAEFGIPAATDDHLQLASQAGLGTYERGDPWGSGYTAIDYVKMAL